MNIFRKRAPDEQRSPEPVAETENQTESGLDWQDAEQEADRVIAEKAARRAREAAEKDGMKVSQFLGIDEFRLENEEAKDERPARAPREVSEKIASIRPGVTHKTARPQRPPASESMTRRRPPRNEHADDRISKLRQQFILDDADPEDIENSPMPVPKQRVSRVPNAEPRTQADAFVAAVEQEREQSIRPSVPVETVKTAAPAAPQPAQPIPSEPVQEMVHVPTPSVGRAGGRAGRVKTRLLGFEPSAQAETNPFDRADAQAAAKPAMFPVGWLVVTDGPGRGASFTLFNGVSQIGRGEDQTVKLDFGDNSISRSGHAVLAFDPETKKFFIGHNGKANIVRLNNKPVLSTEELTHGDVVKLGETTLRFVAMCGEDFIWSQDSAESQGYAAQQ